MGLYDITLETEEEHRIVISRDALQDMDGDLSDSDIERIKMCSILKAFSNWRAK